MVVPVPVPVTVDSQPTKEEKQEKLQLLVQNAKKGKILRMKPNIKPNTGSSGSNGSNTGSNRGGNAKNSSFDDFK